MSKNKGNIFITIISNVISIGVALIISFFVTQYIVTHIGKEAYSFYPIANNFSTYFSAIFLITNSLSSRFIMIPYLKGNYEDSSKYCSTVLFSNIIITAIVFVIETIFYLNINNIVNIPEYLLIEVKRLFMFTFMSSIIYGLSNYFSIGYYVKERMDLQAITSIAENVAKGSIVLYLLLNNQITIASFGFSLFIAACTRSVLDIVFYFCLMKDIPIRISSFSKNNLLEITKLGIWSLISRSGSLLIANIQLIISNIFLGVDKAGELALIQPLVSVCTLVASTVARFVDPTITKNISKYNDKSRSNLSYIYTIIEVCIVIPICIVLAISGSFYKLWIPNEYSDILYLLTILSCIEIIVLYLSTINESVLTTFFKEKEKAITYLLTGLFNLLLVYLMLSFTNLGNIGIILAAIISYIFYHLIFVYKYARHTLNRKNIQIDYLSVKDYILYIVIILLNIVITSFITPKNYLILILTCFLLFVIDVMIIFLIKKIKIKNFINFLTNKN